MTSFFSQVMEPGGGLILLPFVRAVIGVLLVLTTGAALMGVARVHMVILSVLSGGLLISLWFFEQELQKMQRSNSRNSSAPPTSQASGKGAAATKTD